MSVKTSGDGQITLDDGFSAKVVVAHWNKDATNPVTGSQGALDLTAFPNHTITFDQIQAAISWWLNNQAIPYTSAVNKDATNAKLDFSIVETLVAYWLTNTSVFNPLPTN
jgi:hypothetical protein